MKVLANSTDKVQDIAKLENSYSDADSNSSSSGSNTEKSFMEAKSVKPGFQTKFQVWRNLLTICLCFMLLFTSFQSLSTLQSSLFIDDGMGTTVLAVIYSCFVLSSFFVPSMVINCLGCKWTIGATMLGYIAFMVAHFYPTWEVFIPAAVIAGLSAAPLWTAQSTFINLLATDYSIVTSTTKETATNFFFGIFFFFYQAAFVWGHIISSQVLGKSNSRNSSFASLTDEELSQCGYNFCPTNVAKTNNSNLDETPKETIQLLAGLYTGCAFIALLVIIFLLQQHPSEELKLNCSRDTLQFSKLVATFLLLKNKFLLLLIPLTMYGGMQTAFVFSDFTQALLTCPLGNWWVGPIMICYGICTASSSLISGRVVQYTGRAPLLCLAACLHGGLIITYLHFETTQHLYQYFIFAGLWGTGVGIWKPQLNSLYGLVFHHDTKAAYSNYKLWDSAGNILQYFYQSRLCFTYKAYILLGALAIGMTGYVTTEVIQYRDRKRNDRLNDTDEKITSETQT